MIDGGEGREGGDSPCRGGVAADAMGWLKVGAEWMLMAPGRDRIRERIRGHAMYPCSGPSCRDKTPTPTCLFFVDLGWIGSYKLAP